MRPIIVATAYLTDRKDGKAGGPQQNAPAGLQYVTSQGERTGLVYDMVQACTEREAGQKEGKT